VLRDDNSHLGPLVIRDYIKGKKILHHHHGHPHFRANPEYYRQKYQRLNRKVLVSTPDLLKLLPAARWLPNLVPIDHPLLKPQTASVNGKVIIGQSPTRKELKNTEGLVSVVAALQARRTGPQVALRIIERLPHKQCLIEKNRCHVVFDHMQGYYGVSSLESLSHGKPVIAGLDEWNIRCIKEFTGAYDLPWVIARDENELREQLSRLVGSSRLRGTLGTNARCFMERCWSEHKVIERLMPIYRSL
jgi:hypothetical protein